MKKIKLASCLGISTIAVTSTLFVVSCSEQQNNIIKYKYSFEFDFKKDDTFNVISSNNNEYNIAYEKNIMEKISSQFGEISSEEKIKELWNSYQFSFEVKEGFCQKENNDSSLDSKQINNKSGIIKVENIENPSTYKVMSDNMKVVVSFECELKNK